LCFLPYYRDVLPVIDPWRRNERDIYSQMDMFRPVFRGLTKIVEEAVPGFLEETLEAGILFLINHLCKKASLAAPGERLDCYTERRVADIPTVT
jgi:hypothetical protein